MIARHRGVVPPEAVVRIAGAALTLPAPGPALSPEPQQVAMEALAAVLDARTHAGMLILRTIDIGEAEGAHRVSSRLPAHAFAGVVSRCRGVLPSEKLHDTSCLITDLQMPGLTGIDLQNRQLALRGTMAGR
jgi:CheY-like chemotaxis protein